MIELVYIPITEFYTENDKDTSVQNIFHDLLIESLYDNPLVFFRETEG